MKKRHKEQWQVVKGDVTKLGVKRTERGVNFAIIARGEQPDTLILFQKGTDQIVQVIDFKDAAVMGNVMAVEVIGTGIDVCEYQYQKGGTVIQDPCAEVIIGDRAGFAGEYDWQGDRMPHLAYHESMMYSLHVRGFTMKAKVRSKGTFKGLQEQAIYIHGLGFNQVKLMPIYEFDTDMESVKGQDSRYALPAAGPTKKNFWGYGPGYYFAPKAAYAETADPVTEFKDMIREFHRLGMEVIMELAFTTSIDYRVAAACLLHWRQNYHVDGFYLVGNQALANIFARDPLLTDVKLLGEYFPQEEIYGKRGVPKEKVLAEYNDGFKYDMRRLIKGADHSLEAFAYRNRRVPEYCGVINYIADHNGFTLMDMVSYDERHNEANGEQNRDGAACNESWNCGIEGVTRKKKILDLRYRQIKNALVMLFLSAGTPMLMAGDELGNTQQGNNNPYCQDNEIGWVDWKHNKRNDELQVFVKGLTDFRKAHPILHQEKELRLMDTRSCGYPDLSYHGDRAWYGDFENGRRHLGVMYCGEYAGEECFIYAAYNLHWAEHQFALPHLAQQMQWHIAIDTGAEVYEKGKEPLLEEQKSFEVSPRTVVVLIGRKKEQHGK